MEDEPTVGNGLNEMQTPSEKAVRRKREYAPKVRTGCLTCKARRIKCDEMKPACERCLKRNINCGYLIPAARSKNTPRRELLRIAPRKLTATGTFSLFFHGIHFKDCQEYQCFKLFRERTMLDLVGSDDSDLWSKTVLQACEHDDVFRYAVIAIGGLDRTLELSQAGGKECPVGRTGIDPSVASHYQFALRKYDQFIVEMRRRLLRTSQDLRETLISCILAVCFELYQGNHSIALTHASAGMNMIRSFLSKADRERRPHGIDPGLISIFLRLDQLSSTSALQSLIRTHVNTGTHLPGMVLHDLPHKFSSCGEARLFWKTTVIRISHALNSTNMVLLGPDSCVDYLRQWSAAFRPLFEASRQESGKNFRCKAAFLQLRHNTTLLALVGSFSESELVYDDFVSLFEEVLLLAQEVLEPNGGSSKRRPIFTFDIGVIGALWAVATKCRDCEMRWTAVSLLLKNPRREGVWDSAMIAAFASTLIRIEETGLESSVLPENIRVRAESFSFDMIQKKGQLIYSHLAKETTVGLERVYRNVDVTW